MKYFLIGSLALLFCCQSKSSGNKASNAPLPESSVYWLNSQWKDQDGNNIHLKDLRGNVVVMAMMFTSCKASCPRLVADVQSIEQALNAGKLEKMTFLLCSIDPEYDLPSRLKAYAREHHLPPDHWKLLTGNQNAVQELSALLGVKFKKTAPMEISHSNIITVLNKDGEIYFQQEGIEGDPQTIIQAIDKVLD